MSRYWNLMPPGGQPLCGARGSGHYIPAESGSYFARNSGKRTNIVAGLRAAGGASIDVLYFISLSRRSVGPDEGIRLTCKATTQIGEGSACLFLPFLEQLESRVFLGRRWR